MNMANLRPLQAGRVLKIQSEGAFRLQELGLRPGAEVRCLFASPLGDPRAYLIRGAAIALRKEDAECVILDKIWD